MVTRNRSRYDSETVRRLVRFAVSEVDMRGVCVNVKNSRSAFRGMAYERVPNVSDAPASAEHLVTIGIGPPEAFPVTDHVCGHASGVSNRLWPRYDMRDWREALVVVAAHEAKHIEQYKENKPRSEIACEHFAAYVLRKYRDSLS